FYFENAVISAADSGNSGPGFLRSFAAKLLIAAESRLYVPLGIIPQILPIMEQFIEGRICDTDNLGKMFCPAGVIWDNLFSLGLLKRHYR
ncbi:MAG TPA: hypothetical protein VLH40_05140, partial [Atribacteraceae bacterium]|nr:hypothetical protein [Atribacteraceae bacterium]